jgi:hypothetical protein
MKMTLALICWATMTVMAPAGTVTAATISVASGGNLQAALNAARPGDTIALEAGAVFTGSFQLPAKGGTTFITIRSAAPDALLPPAGVRISPSYSSRLPKIRSTSAGAALRTAPGATWWRLMFLEVLPAPATSTANLVELGTTTTQTTLATVPQHLVVDRCYLHGDAAAGQRRGIALNSGDTQILSSYFADFKAVSQDTQAIAGWNGPGPFLIDNNYLEAAGENVMFGGADPAIPGLAPSGISIRRNQIAKPLAWRSLTWTVKNLLELKNAQNVTIEGNLLENNWASGQPGYAIVLTPRNQGHTAPWSVVKDVVIRNNVIRHVAGVFNVLGYDNLAPSQQTERITVRNNLAYDVSTAYGTTASPSSARFVLVGAGPKDISFDHNTVDSNGSSTVFIYAGATPTGPQITGFVLTNNLLRDNQYGLYGDGVGEGTPALTTYCPNAVVVRNTFAGGSAAHYPTGNDFPTLQQWLDDFESVTLADYRLKPTSRSKNSGTDGNDLGVDFTELTTAMVGMTPPL